ncbi:MAG: CAP domain-containing protein [Anaerolineaceae bacterium]|nr:CAP domain-containing protein [Anaerolineaceae bacterium]
MRIRQLSMLGLLLAALLLVNGMTLQAQTGMLDTNQTMILDAINEFRRPNGLQPLVPNADLNRIAQEFAADLKQRYDNSETVVDVYINSDGQNIDQLLAQTAYAQYSDGYVVDFIPARLGRVGPDAVISYLIDDSQKPQRTVFSRAMARDKRSFLPLGDPKYREVGIGFVDDPDSDRYYYMLLFAARPNELPVVITDLKVVVEQVSSRNVYVRPHNENTHTNGDRIDNIDVIGRVQAIRVSETPGKETCPTGITLPAGWESYRPYLPYTLSDGSGLKTVYVQMCDAAGRTVVSSAQVTYTDPRTPAPDSNLATPLGLAQMTQTAAAQATLYAPLQPTIEAILTATASAPLPTPTAP